MILSIPALLFSIAVPLAYVYLQILVEGTKVGTSTFTKGQRLELEYETLNQAVRQREQTMGVTGSIFVAQSLFLLGISQSLPEGSQQVTIFGSWIVFSIWLFFIQLGDNRMMKKTYDRLRWIEEQLNFEAHTYLMKQRDRLKRWAWFALLCTVLAYGNILMDQVILAVWTVVIVAVVLIFSHLGWIWREERKK